MCTLTTYNRCQHWDPIHAAAVSILKTYVVNNDQQYLNSLDVYALCIVHEQNSFMVRHERTNYACVIAFVPYSTQCDVCVYLLVITVICHRVSLVWRIIFHY